MILFWLAALALVGVTLAIILPPLLRSPRTDTGGNAPGAA